MIEILPAPWEVILGHARACYPRECCGILLGEVGDGGSRRRVTIAVACANAYQGEQSDRFELDPADQFEAQRLARKEGLEVLGFFHSHPDCDAYFSATDLAHSWPWYSNLVVSIRHGGFDHARAFRANEAQTESTSEELICPTS
ncbi:MAG: M67 family metallopeptidase [Candidatus Solibacter usitatus]|nr:M67 family metallopeptidase [Candidatus Solibacter usitatus]